MKLFVTTLALAAAVSNGANLRTSAASSTAMREFMQRYGDQVSVEKEFRHNPQAVLKKFINQQRARTLKEHKDALQGGKERCTTDHNAKVTLNQLFGPDEARLEGCAPDSTCAKESETIYGKRDTARRCVSKLKHEMDGKSKSLAKKLEDLEKVHQQVNSAAASREKQMQAYKTLVGQNREAVELLTQVKKQLMSGSDSPVLLETEKQTLSRTVIGDNYMSLLEAAGSSRTERLLKLVNEFIKAIQGHTMELDSNEAKEAANHRQMMKVYAERKNDANAVIDSAKESKSEVFEKFKECKTDLAAAKQDFNDLFERCRLHQEKFSQSTQDNIHIINIMDQVYKMIHTHLGWDAATGPSDATGATAGAMSGATGPVSTSAATASTGATGAFGATRL